MREITFRGRRNDLPSSNAASNGDADSRASNAAVNRTAVAQHHNEPLDEKKEGATNKA